MADEQLMIGCKFDASALFAGLQSSTAAIGSSTAQWAASFQEFSATSAEAASSVALLPKAAAEAAVQTKESGTAIENTFGRVASTIKEATASAGESLAKFREKMVLTSEGARISALGVGSAFGGLGAILGAGIVFEFLDRMKEGVLQLGHLAEASGVSIEKLAELRASMQEMGVSADRMSLLMARLSSNMYAAAEGGKTQAKMFKDLGVDTTAWGNTLPPLDGVLLQIADHLHKTASGAQTLGEAYKLLGRNSQETIAFLSQGSEAIKQQMSSYKELGEEIARTESAAKDLQRQEAQLSAEFSTISLPVLRFIVESLRFMSAVLISARGELENFGRFMLLAAQDALALNEGLLAFNRSAVTLNFKGMEAAFSGTVSRITDNWHLAMLDMEQTTASAVKSAAKFLGDQSNSFIPPKSRAVLPDPTGGGITRLQEWKEKLEEIKALDESFLGLSKQQELDYWETIRAQNTLTFKEKVAVLGQINQLHRAVLQEGLRDELSYVQDAVAANAKGSQDRLLIMSAELSALHARGLEATSEYKTLNHELTVAVQADFAAMKKAADELSQGIIAGADRQVATMQRARDEDLRSEVQHVQKMAELQRQQIADLANLGVISPTQRIQAQQATLNAEREAEAKLISELEQMYQHDLVNFEKVEKLKTQLADQAAKQQLQITQQTQQRVMQAFQAGFVPIENGLRQMVNGFIQGGQTMRQTMSRAALGILESWADSMVQLLSKWVETHIAMALYHQIFGQQQVASTAISSAQEHATKSASNFAGVVSDSGLAAATAYAYWAWNPALATAMAAQAAATTLAVGAPAAFATGGLVEGSGGSTSDSVPARLSPGEFVVKAAAVNRIGVEMLHAINEGEVPGMMVPRFAEGGFVMPAPLSFPHVRSAEDSAAKIVGGNTVNNSNNSRGGDTHLHFAPTYHVSAASPKFNPADHARETMDALQKEIRRRNHSF